MFGFLKNKKKYQTLNFCQLLTVVVVVGGWKIR
jgi:hypothetical protein